MKKLDFYAVYCYEVDNNYQSVRRSTFFETAREARSYFRICKEYYKRMEQGFGLDHVFVKLIKAHKNCEYDQIDVFYRYF